MSWFVTSSDLYVRRYSIYPRRLSLLICKEKGITYLDIINHSQSLELMEGEEWLKLTRLELLIFILRSMMRIYLFKNHKYRRRILSLEGCILILMGKLKLLIIKLMRKLLFSFILNSLRKSIVKLQEKHMILMEKISMNCMVHGLIKLI